MEELFRTHGIYRACMEAYADPHEEVTLIRTQEQWLYFCRDWNAGFVRNVAHTIEHRMPGEKCGGLFLASEIFHTQYRGDGGIQFPG